MGGNAFSSGPSPLLTPRLPPEIYFQIRDHYQCLLRALYKRVSTPIEAPSKSSHGDIDILVSSDSCTNPPSPETGVVAALVNAKRTFTTAGSPTTSFAVPYPNLPDNYVQVDVHVCPPETFEWELFHQSHGDLWNLLGTTIRPVGLTANDHGLHLRIEEIEASDRRKSLVFLTKEPEAVVSFLGLDVERYGKPFGSVEEMYGFVKECRFFDASRYGTNGLKANDRKRMKQREIYRRFVEEWVPVYCELPEDVSTMTPTRAEILEEALETFDKRDEFEAQLKEWRTKQADLLARQEKKKREGRKGLWAEAEAYADGLTSWLEQRK